MTRKWETDTKNIREIGRVESFFSGVAKINGIDGVLLNEVLTDNLGKPVAIVVGFNKDHIDAIFFKEDFDLSTPVFSSGKTFKIPVSDRYVGRIVNGIGLPVDNKPKITGEPKNIFSDSPQTMDRVPITRPLVTGIKAIDTTLPLGRGQRELIVGDRKLGKTTIAVDTVINQNESTPRVYCVYVICGRKDDEVEKIVNIFKKNGALRYTTVVAAPSSSPLSVQYLAPMVGTTIAEGFRDKGNDSLVIYDDLSSHAKVARSISLLLKRAPGREVYPGDIFSLHASLLERSAQLSKKLGGGSMTALPIMETQEGDLASYIATNLISITDGQIYLDRNLFDRSFLPAIDIGLSVSRIGGQAQENLLKQATKDLRLSLAQNRELERLSQLETNLSEESKERIKRGKIILELLKQEKHTFVSWKQQVLLFYTAGLGLLDGVNNKNLNLIENDFLNYLYAKRKMVVARLDSARKVSSIKDDITKATEDFLEEFEEKENESIS